MWTRLARLAGIRSRRSSRRDAAPGDPFDRLVRMVAAAGVDRDAAADRPGEAFERSWRAGVKRRVLLVLGLLGAWATVVEGRLIQLQVVDHAALQTRAIDEQSRTLTPVATRGDILDRHGEVLAYSVGADDIIADPSAVKDDAGTARAICAALGDCTAQERVDLTGKLAEHRAFVYVRRARSVTPDQAVRVGDLKLKGISLVPESRRFYPHFDLAAHVLGFVGTDNSGLGGIEQAYDADIRGRDGLTVVLTDARDRPFQTVVKRAPTTGATVELTLDLYLQYIAERELRAGIAADGAIGGTAIIMDPRTGEVLALANLPTFNPNAYERFSADARRDRAVQDVYEPGSTFKIVTASAALQEGVWSTADTVDTNPGYLDIGKRRIHDDQGHNWGVLPFEDVIVKSSNVGAAKIALRMGAERMERYVRRFGFGETLSPDFSGQSIGIVRPLAAVTESTLASMAMGYEVSVTPLQMAAAVSAVANGGTLYAPHVVRAIVRDGVREAVDPKAVRTPITSETAAELTSIMEDVVRRGTGTKAQVPGFVVAGKTGTAQKAIPGGYSQTDYHASFVGFVPSRAPVLAIVVVLDTPRYPSYFGGDTAAPIFERIAEASLRQLGVAPTINPAPAIIVAASDANLPSDRAVAVPATLIRPPDGTRMPDVGGLAARDALRVLGNSGLVVKLDGTGTVIGQTPLAGESIVPGESVMLRLGRPGTTQPPARPGKIGR